MYQKLKALENEGTPSKRRRKDYSDSFSGEKDLIRQIKGHPVDFAKAQKDSPLYVFLEHWMTSGSFSFRPTDHNEFLVTVSSSDFETWFS